MSSIENILNQIEDSTQKEIEEIKTYYLEKIEKMKNSYAEILKEETKKNNEKIENKKKELKKNFDVEISQFKNRTILGKKDEILKKTINLALKTFCEEKTNSYLQFIENMLKKTIPQTEGKLIFGEKDYDFFKDYKTLNEKIAIEKSTNFEHGFKFICKNYILNCETKEIFNQNIENLKKVATKALYLEDNNFE